VTADGGYDGDKVYDEVLQRHSAARVIIPPRSTAVLSEAGTNQADDHLRSKNNTAASDGNIDVDMAGGASSKRRCIAATRVPKPSASSRSGVRRIQQ
jgi:hypothetical protein